jgi:PKD repeat protein
VYAADSIYTVTLTVSDTSGSTPAVATQDVTVSPVAGPSIVETTPILPDFSPMIPNLRPIYEAGLASGNRPNVFALVGDLTADSTNYLDPFGDPSTYTLQGGGTIFQTIIDQYSADQGDGTNSFNRTSVATGNFTAQDLLSPGINYDAACSAPGETLLGCELRLTAPSVVIINIGYADALAGTDPASFEAQIDQIIQTALNANVIPVLTTIYPYAGDSTIIDRIEALNEAIINSANTAGVPVYNAWRALNELPGSGLAGDNTPLVAPEGPGFIADGVTAGANIRNAYMLALLNSLNTSVFQ